MAETYALSVTPSCATATNGGGVLTVTTDYAGSPPTAEQGTTLVLVRGGADLAQQPASRNATFTFSGLVDDSYTVEWRLTDTGEVLATGGATISCDSGTGGGGGGGGGNPPVLGCMLPNAFNYDPAATQDTTPTSCVLVLVDTAPAQLIAAHLPIPCVVRAAPSADGQPALVRLRLSTAPLPTTPAADWVEFGTLAAVCAADNQAAAFNLSEAATSLLRILPPVEEGVDPALSALLRVRYERLDPDTREVTHAGLVGTCRVLNAVVQPVANQLLNRKPDRSIPVGANWWVSRATFADGVVSVVSKVPAIDCPARQFVWLNAAGAWESGFFSGRHQHGTDVADGVGYRDLAAVDRWASRGQVRPTLAVYSDLLDWPTYQAVRAVRTSIQVYERRSDEAVEAGAERYVPVRVVAESYPEYQEQTDKTYQVNFTVSYPAQLIQTQ